MMNNRWIKDIWERLKSQQKYDRTIEAIGAVRKAKGFLVVESDSRKVDAVSCITPEQVRYCDWRRPVFAEQRVIVRALEELLAEIEKLQEELRKRDGRISELEAEQADLYRLIERQNQKLNGKTEK